MKRRLSASPAKIVLFLGLLTAFVLLMFAHEFMTTNPALASILIFIFSLPYLAVAAGGRRGSFLYGTMLFGAVAYFLACYALGSPALTFPVLSVPLVGALLGVGHRLRRRLPDELASFPATVFNAMNITVAVFALWALTDVSTLMGQGGLARYVAGAAFLAYAGLYLIHSLAGSTSRYVYVMALFATVGSILVVVAAGRSDLCWLAVMASAAVIMLVGTRGHRQRQYGWSRHYYFAATAVVVISMPLSLWRWQYVLIDLALGALLLQAAYGWLAAAVPNVRQAMMAERVMAKFFFVGSVVLSMAIAPVAFFLSWDPYVAYAALISGAMFAWVARQRPDHDSGGWNLYALGAVVFVAAGLLGIGRQLPASFAQVWSLASLLAVLAALGVLVLRTRTQGATLSRSLAAGALFPACLGWLIPLMQNELVVAMIAAAATALVLVVLAASLKERSFGIGIGPAIAGVLIAGALMWMPAESALLAWIICAVVAAGWYVYADAQKQGATRGATNLAWLILSVAAVVLAGQTGLSHLLFTSVIIGIVSILMSGRPRTQGARDVFELLVWAMGVVMTFTAVAVGPFTELSSIITGACLLSLALAHWTSWGMRRGAGAAYLANGLFALGSLLVIYGAVGGVEARLLAGAAVVGVLFIVGALARTRQSRLAQTAAATGHLTAVVLACGALIQAWPMDSTLLAAAAAPLILLYAVMPVLRRDTGFKIGTMLWLSFAAVFALALVAQSPYIRQLHLIVLFSLAWVAVGYALSRTPAKTWSLPLYISAAAIACFCSLMKMSTPVSVGGWHVFLTAGMVFAYLFLILKHDVFAYMLTLSLSLLAYDWARHTTSIFTQDALYWLVIIGLVVAALFILPYVRRRIAKMGTVPIFHIFTWRGVTLFGVMILACVVLLLSTYTLKVTGHPKFCMSCHNMDEYYASWEHSSHADVACIQCHYEPGVVSTAKGKIAGLVQVVLFVSDSYTTKPHAEVADSSCMRSECHAGIDTEAEPTQRTVLTSIKFRHDTHLGDPVRGVELNCVSCHGMASKDEHMGVQKTTCVTCHFYGDPTGQVVTASATSATNPCLTCHTMPAKTMEFMDQEFSHTEFLADKGDIQCTLCHSQVTQGDGATSTARCANCHLGEREKVTDPAEFHLVHVSEGHFDCLQCHDQIKHGSRPTEKQLLASGDCTRCHSGERHSVQERIYAGTAVAAMATAPDPMYKAGVSCNGCHTESRPVGMGMSFTMNFSGPRQCGDCHSGPASGGGDSSKTRYGRMLGDWQDETKERIDELKPELARLAKAIASATAPSDAELAKTKGILAGARTKLSVVVADGSYGAHNYPYVSEILDEVEDEIDTCDSAISQWGQARREEAGE